MAAVPLRRTPCAELKRCLLDLFEQVKSAHVSEAIAAARGFRSNAALRSKYIGFEDNHPIDLPHPERFFSRLSDFGYRIDPNEPSAEAAIALLKGACVEVDIVRLPEPRQRAWKYTDIAYDVNVQLSGVPVEVMQNDITFHLPQFGQDAQTERYRIDSAHDRRAAADYRLDQYGRGNTRVAKLVNGHWYGGFYVYENTDQHNDIISVRAAKAALTRAILMALPIDVRCVVFRPDIYEIGRAWRVEMRVPQRVLTQLGGFPLVFELPRFDSWLFQAAPEHRHNGLEYGRFVDGLWRADLYSNGLPEVDNAVHLMQVKLQLLKNVKKILMINGVDF